MWNRRTRTPFIAGVTAGLLLVAGGVFAEGEQGAEEESAVAAAEPQQAGQAVEELTAAELIGHRVTDADGSLIGKVTDVVRDAGSRELMLVVAATEHEDITYMVMEPGELELAEDELRMREPLTAAERQEDIQMYAGDLWEPVERHDQPLAQMPEEHPEG